MKTLKNGQRNNCASIEIDLHILVIIASDACKVYFFWKMAFSIAAIAIAFMKMWENSPAL